LRFRKCPQARQFFALNQSNIFHFTLLGHSYVFGENSFEGKHDPLGNLFPGALY
jgi:hypothetical protein